MAGKTVKVKLVKSAISANVAHQATVRGLGLRRMHQTRELEDTPAVRGMIKSVAFLVKVV
ncbi:MAG: 50S ribosomal protein L30 [Pseudomonadota bacterium]|nr:50S ribosomal protein L30 [Burkholderiaceae bacterium]MDQ3447290.1 50S ribosomal protein L30 [Pseudomonadota bacterium]